MEFQDQVRMNRLSEALKRASGIVADQQAMIKRLTSENGAKDKRIWELEACLEEAVRQAQLEARLEEAVQKLAV
jgi:hypothetical protein